MAKRQTTFLLKRSNVPGKIPPISGLTSGELALNTADAILYTSGSTSGTILPIGWDRVSRTGDTMTGSLFAPSISATTVSATTYFNLPTDVRVTGGTFNDTTGVATFTNNTGGTFNVNGFSIGGGGSVFTGGTVTGPTNFTNGLSATTISATTYQNLPTDVFVTGGTYTSGNAIFTNNTGGTFTVTGFSTGGTSSTDTFVTGATYSNNTFTYRNNTGGTFNVLFNTVTGLTSSGTISTSVLSATTYQNLPIDIRVTGGTYSNGTTTFTNNSGGTFTITGFNTGTTTGNGTANYLPKWTGSTGQGNSQIRDDGTNIAIGMAPDTDNKFSIITFSNNYYGLWVRNASSISGAKGIYGLSNGNVGTQAGVWGVGEGHPTTGTSIGVDGGATDGLLGIGVRGTVGTSEFGSMVTGIGGYFDGRGDGGYGYPTNSYSLQLLDGTEGINKVLVSKTSDGKANWSSTLSGLTSVVATTVSATTISGKTMVITSTPTTDNTATQVLARDPLTGIVELVDISSLNVSFNYGLANAIMTGNFLT